MAKSFIDLFPGSSFSRQNLRLGGQSEQNVSKLSFVDRMWNLDKSTETFSGRKQLKIGRSSLPTSSTPTSKCTKLKMDENLSELLVKKEKELQEISKLRLIQLEDQLKNRNFTIQELQQKLEKIQEDFQYNLNLIDDRDAELLEIEEKFENIRKILKQKDTEISELRATIASLEQRVKIENNKIKTSEMVLIQSRDQLREELAEVK